MEPAASPESGRPWPGRAVPDAPGSYQFKDADGRVLGIAATMQDVTARWERDKALRARLAELETKLKQAGVVTENKS